MSLDGKYYRARITKRVDFAPDLWMIRIDPDAEFTFSPGQYATLGVERDTRRLERPYSIVSSPYEREIEFFFELVPHGQTTPPLCDLQPGDQVLMRRVPKGRFTLDRSQPDRKNLLMLSTVTGVAPFVSYVRTLFADWKEGNFAGDHKVGRVDDLIRKYADHWGCTAANSMAYLCGHPEMIEHSKGILKRIGFEKENFKEEVYWVPAKAA